MTYNKNQVYCADAIDFLDALPYASCQMVLTDPPYGVDFVSNMPKEGNEKAAIHNDDLEAALKIQRASLRRYKDILVDGGVLAMFCAGGGPRPLLPKFWEMIADTPGFAVENVLVWDRLDLGLGWRYRPQWEGIIIAIKGDTRRTWNGPSNRSNVIRCPRIIPKVGEHPTPKPVSILVDLIWDNTNEGDCILDPFCGGGSVPYAAAREKREFYACDLEPRYAEMSQERVAAEQKQLKLF
jgi:site-specific DNA-methyltransferase (adenine-specific)